MSARNWQCPQRDWYGNWATCNQCDDMIVYNLFPGNPAIPNKNERNYWVIHHWKLNETVVLWGSLQQMTQRIIWTIEVQVDDFFTVNMFCLSFWLYHLIWCFGDNEGKKNVLAFFKILYFFSLNSACLQQNLNRSRYLVHKEATWILFRNSLGKANLFFQAGIN